jgi:hypothetical protein
MDGYGDYCGGDGADWSNDFKFICLIK